MFSLKSLKTGAVAVGVLIGLLFAQALGAATYSVTDAGEGAGCNNAWPPSIVGNYAENGTLNGYPRYDNGTSWYIYRVTISGYPYWVVSNSTSGNDFNNSTIAFYQNSSASTPPTGSSYTNTNSACGRISIASGGGASAPSAPTIYNFGSPPYISGGSATVYWSAVSGVIGYKLDVATDAAFSNLLSGYNPKVVNNTPTPDTFTTVSGLTSAGTTYYFRVRAYNSVGDSSNSSTLSTTTIPATPTATSASSITGATFQANWNAQTGASSYKLYVCTNSGFTTCVSGYNPASVSGTSESLTGLTPATTYYYRLKASSENGDSSVSNTISLTTNALPALSGTFTTAGAVNDDATIAPFSGVSVSDANANNVSMAITYTAANGTLTGSGLTGSAGSYTLTAAAPATVSSYLQALVFHPTLHQGAPGSTVTTTFTLTPNDGIDNGVANSSTSVTTTMVNVAPTFVGATTTLSVNANSSATDIKSLLHASDSDSGQTLTWSQNSAPAHGSLSFSSATAATGSADITPGGTITYTPTAGYSGTDSFAVQVSDTWATATRTISVTVVAVTPGAPTSVSATAGDAQASVSFTAPSNTGGSAITSYTATCTSSDGGASGAQSGAGSPLSVAGLTNGKTYTCTVSAANSAGSGSASSASSSFIPKANQTITFTNPGAQTFATTPTLSASTSATGLTVTLSSATTGVCTITSGGVLAFVSAGTCTINADQSGSAAYNSASQVQQSFTVNAVVPGAPTIGVVTPGDGQASVAFSAPASGGGAAISGYTATCASSDGGATGSQSGAASPLAVTGLTNGKTYTCSVIAANSVGSGSASAASSSFTPKANQTISFTNPGAQNFGTTPTLSATAAPSGLTVSFTSATTGVCTISSGGALTFVAAGSCTVNADQSGSSVYNAAAQVQQSFTVNPVAPGAPTGVSATPGDTLATVSYTAPTYTGGSPISGYTATCASSDGGASGTQSGTGLSRSVTGLTNGKAYTCTVTASNGIVGPASSASGSFVPKATQTITFTPNATYNFGTTPTLTASAAPSGLTVSFASTTTGVCTITSDGTLTFLTTGTCSIDADQAGNGSFNAAATVSRSFTVAAVVPGAPTGVAASPGENQATVTFTAPTFNGGATISAYTATCTSSDGGATGAQTGSAAPLLVAGLTNGKTYTCTVSATNSAGAGSASTPSNSITPNVSPKVLSVAVPATGKYKAGRQLDFTVSWDNNVTVSATPRLALTIGAASVYADYQSSPTASAMLFRYVVLAGQNAPSGVVVGALGLNGGSIKDATTGIDATLTLNSVASSTGVVVDTTAPTLPAANIVVDNRSDPHQIVLTFSEALDGGSIGAANAWTVTANGGSPAYALATAALASGNQITLTLNSVNLSDSATYIPNSAANAHLRVTPPATLSDSAGNSYLAGQVVESGATPVLDVGAPTLTAVSASAPTSSGGTLAATANEKARAYWIAVAAGATAPSVAEVKAAVSYAGVAVAAGGNAVLPSAVAGSLTLSGLAASTAYDIHVMAEDAAGNSSAVIGTTAITTTAAPQPNTVTNAGNVALSSGGGTAAPSNGQTVIVSDNGANGSTITLPSPTTTSGGTTTTNSIKVDLPNNSGTVNVSSNSEGTRLGVQNTVLPGTTTVITTVTVDQGSASFTATRSGQAVAGLKNGIVILSGSEDSKVSVDATGTSAKIGVTSSDTIVVPSGASNISGTVVDLPAPTSSGESTPITVKSGDQTITIQASHANTTMTFQVIEIDGVKTPVLAVSGTAQVGSSGDNQPLVSVGGNVIRSGSSAAGQKCDTVIQAGNTSGADVIQVVTCYVVLAPGSFSAIGGKAGTGFAALKDGVIWAGETAEFDSSGIVTGAYLGTREGISSAPGDDLLPGGNKFTAAGHVSNAFIPRLNGKPLRLQGKSLDEMVFYTFNKVLGATTVPTTPSQNAQGILSFRVSGDAAAGEQARNVLNFDLQGDSITVFPSRRIRVDTSRADGVRVSSEGNVEVATGGLITTFAPTVADPLVFAADIARVLPGATTIMRWNGSWKITTADGGMFVGRPQWGNQPAGSGSGFAVLPDGTVQYSANGRSQILVADLHDYTTVQETFAREFGDPNFLILPRMDGVLQAAVKGKIYLLTPQWKLVPAEQVSGQPAWWLDNGVVYVKNADGTAQGFTVK